MQANLDLVRIELRCDVVVGMANGDVSEHGFAQCRLTPRWSGRVDDKVPSSNVGARAAQLNR